MFGFLSTFEISLIRFAPVDFSSYLIQNLPLVTISSAYAQTIWFVQDCSWPDQKKYIPFFYEYGAAELLQDAFSAVQLDSVITEASCGIFDYDSIGLWMLKGLISRNFNVSWISSAHPGCIAVTLSHCTEYRTMFGLNLTNVQTRM